MPQSANPQAPQASDTTRVTFVTRESPERYEVDITGDLTGQQAILGLVEQAGLARPTSELSYALKLKRVGAELPLDRPLLQSGVQQGDVIIVVRSDIGAWRTP
jgi:hypothetical protein